STLRKRYPRPRSVRSLPPASHAHPASAARNKRQPAARHCRPGSAATTSPLHYVSRSSHRHRQPVAGRKILGLIHRLNAGRTHAESTGVHHLQQVHVFMLPLREVHVEECSAIVAQLAIAVPAPPPTRTLIQLVQIVTRNRLGP